MKPSELRELDQEQILAEIAHFMGYRPRSHNGDLCSWFEMRPRQFAEDDPSKPVDCVPRYTTDVKEAVNIFQKLGRKEIFPTVFTRHCLAKNPKGQLEFAVSADYTIPEAIPDEYWEPEFPLAICKGVLIEFVEAPRFPKP